MRQREKDRLRKAVEKAWAIKDRAEASDAAFELLDRFAHSSNSDGYEAAADRWRWRNIEASSLGTANGYRAYRANDMRLLAEIGA